jgi:hypothetical protein
MMIYFVNNSKREYVYAGEAEGENITDIIADAGWNGFNDNIIMVTDIERYENRGYRDVDSDSSSEPSESESESESESQSESDLDTSDEIDAFMENLRRRDSDETLSDTTTWSLP